MDVHKMTRPFCILVVTVVAFYSCPYVLSQSRTWSDSTGKFKVEAELVEQLGGTVKLKKINGEFVEVPTAQLSKHDRKFIEQFLLEQERDKEPDVKLPPDIVALAELAASDSYYDHIPSYLRTTASLSQLEGKLTQSSNSELSSAATAITKARLRLTQLTIAEIAVLHGIPSNQLQESLGSAIRLLTAESTEDLGARFAIDIFNHHLQRFARLEAAAALNERKAIHRTLLFEQWTEHGIPAIDSLKTKDLDKALSFEFGLVQSMGYTMFKNTYHRDLTNVIITVKYEAQGKSYRVLQFCKELKQGQTLASIAIQPAWDWFEQMTERKESKFNKPLKNGDVKFSVSMISDQGRCEIIEPKIVKGILARKKFISTIFQKGARFHNDLQRIGYQVSKAKTSGSVLKIYFFQGSHVANVDTKWSTGGFTDFQPHSTAFRIRIGPVANRKKKQARSLFGTNSSPSESFKWRGGFLVTEPQFANVTLYYPTLPRKE